MISKKEITHLVERVKPLIEKYQRVSKYGDLTFFEVYTALAFMYFKEQRVDYAVLETGLGGRLDATNVVDPLVCGITPISYDHMDLLGKSLAKIAKEKAGIIKRDEGRGTKDDRYGNSLIVISAAQKKEARAVIKKRCLKEKARLYEVGKDIVWRLGRIKGEWQSFEVRGLKRKYTGLKIKLLGEHQLDNASLAIGMAEALEDKRLSPHVIKRGLMSASWPGRLEIAGRKPTIILDGAQNTASAFTLKEALKKYYTYQKLILVLGISSDKDIEGVCAMLEDIADKVILTKAWNPRAEEPESIKKYIGKPLEVTSDVKKAIVLAKYLAGSKDLILITGSLFVVGEARKIILKAVTNS
ncbi:MAG TPA: bifunctional folylpolyglutamate synthase/dihydrofolate synthase [Candidatus Omnitrophica bacterium]|nr:bifunctional folylpolyglutamate synthase/dihydrofolate synthase [Candidatus Omnitrophota bacterium]